MKADEVQANFLRYGSVELTDEDIASLKREYRQSGDGYAKVFKLACLVPFSLEGW